jgi:Zn ribbon nucleic-acid-binding protein
MQVLDLGRLRQGRDFEGAMQGYRSTPSQRLLNALDRPHCPHCKSRMMLVVIEADSREFFECSKCDYANTIAAPNDPSKSSTRAHIGGKLRSS